MSARVIAPGDLSGQERERWASYCDANAGLQSPFFSFTYIHCVAAVRPWVRVAVIERDGDIAAFFPFQFASRLHAWRGHAERAGGHMTDAFGIIGAPGFEIEPRALLRLSGISYFLFSHLPEAQGQFGLSGDSHDAGLAIDLRMGWQRYWEDISGKHKAFVRDTARRERKLIAEHGPLSFEFDVQAPTKELNHLIAAKSAQYRRTRVDDALKSLKTRRLLHKLAATTEPDCTGILSTLHAGGTWVASHFGLRNRHRLHYWFPVYNPDLEAYAPGRLLTRTVIEETSARGIKQIDRGTGTQAAKQSFSNAKAAYTRGAWWLQGPRSAASRLSMSLSWRAKDISEKFPRHRA